MVKQHVHMCLKCQITTPFPSFTLEGNISVALMSSPVASATPAAATPDHVARRTSSGSAADRAAEPETSAQPDSPGRPGPKRDAEPQLDVFGPDAGVGARYYF